MLIVEVLAPQAPFAIAHCNTFIPTAKPVTLLVSRVGVVIVPLPKITDHVPSPTMAVLPANIVEGELIHNVWFPPALEIVGTLSTCMLIVEVVTPQAPLTILHCKTFSPKAKFVTVELAAKEFVIVPLPEVTDHDPIPTVAALPFKVVEGELIHKIWFDPAFAFVGTRSTSMLIVEVLDPQAPDAIDHCKTFNPAASPVTEVVSRVGVVIVPLPEITDHVPVPTKAVLPASKVVGVLIHIDWLGPAFESVGTLSTCMLNVDVLEQTPLAIVHWRTFVPKANPVKVDAGLLGLVTVPPPTITDHVPIPVMGILPANVVVGLLIHNVWFDPATAAVGILSTWILIVELLVPQPPPLMVHLNTFIPKPKPVSELVASVGVVIMPVPEISDHVPTPLVGVFPAKTVVGLLIHIVWFGPATGIDGIWSTWRFNVDVSEQTLYVIVHANTLLPKPILKTLLVFVVGVTIFALPETTDQLAVPKLGVFAEIVVVGLLIHSVWLGPAFGTPGDGTTYM